MDYNRFVPTGANQWRKAVTSTFVLAVVTTALAEDSQEDTPLLVMLMIFLAVLLCAWYAPSALNSLLPTDYAIVQNRSGTTSLLPAALTLELTLYIWAKKNSLAQVLTTLGVALLLGAAKYVAENRYPDGPSSLQLTQKNDVNVLWQLFYIETDSYIYIWLASRSVILLLEAADANTRWWYLSQALVILSLLALPAYARFSNQTQLSYVVLGMFAVTFVLYSFRSTIPYGMSLVLLAVPAVQVLHAVIPKPYKEESQDRNFAYSQYQPYVALLFVIASMIQQHHFLESNQQHAKSADPSLAAKNMVRMYAECAYPTQSSAYCCTPGTLAHPNSLVLGCIPLACYEAVKDGTRDCCGQLITPHNKRTMAGQYLCVDNMTTPWLA